jgi:hypothetical protein
MTDSEQTPPFDQIAFCRALGLNPDQVVNGSIKIEFTPQGPVVQWTSQAMAPARVLADAMLAGALPVGEVAEPSGDTSENSADAS